MSAAGDSGSVRLVTLTVGDWARRRGLASYDGEFEVSVVLRSLATFSCASACIFATVSPIHAAEIFAGKTITIYVGSGAGGLYDVFGRLVARHIVRHIPGKPNVVVSPMPGAGGITTSNFLYNVAPKDGTALGIVSAALKVMETVPGARYEATKFNWIGRILSSSSVTFTYGPGRVKTFEEALTRESAIAVTAIGNALSIYTRAVNITAGTKFKTIHGYVDAAAGILALERGEIDGVTFSLNSLKNMRPQWLADKTANIIVQYAPVRHSQLPNIATAIEVSRTQEDKDLMAVFMASAETGISIKAPPDLFQECRHILGVHFLSQHPVELAVLRADRSIDVGELSLITIGHDRAARCRCPTPPRFGHTSKTRLVLEDQTHGAMVGIVPLYSGSQCFLEFFFQTACTS